MYEFKLTRTSLQIGSQNASFSQQIADIQRLIQRTGLKFMMHATGTTIGMYLSFPLS